ncbi:MAG: MFS transporter, partial [Desulfovibrionaceae bacterium]|nr:MFS transporter [Desulfovibrionaceae bacterium]
GRKRIYLAGLLGLSLSILACPFSPGGGALIALRFLSGVFSAMMFSSSIAIVVSVVPPSMRARALALNTASVYLALAAGPAAGGFLTYYLGWQSIFFISAALTACARILAGMFIKGEWAEARGEPFDAKGCLIFACALFGLIYGFSNLPQVRGFTFVCVGLLALIAFVAFEKRTLYPLLDVKLFFANRIFSLSCLAALINYAANSATSFLLSLYLQYVKGLDADVAGLALIAQALVQVGASLAAGRLSDSHAPARLATGGMLLCALGLCGLSLAGEGSSLAYLIVCQIIIGLGFGLFSSPNTNMIMSSVEEKHYGQASASAGTMRMVGQALSIGLAAMAISIFVGNSPLSPALYPQLISSFRLTFGIFTVLCLLGAYASSVRDKNG